MFSFSIKNEYGKVVNGLDNKFTNNIPLTANDIAYDSIQNTRRKNYKFSSSLLLILRDENFQYHILT